MKLWIAILAVSLLWSHIRSSPVIQHETISPEPDGKSISYEEFLIANQYCEWKANATELQCVAALFQDPGLHELVAKYYPALIHELQERLDEIKQTKAASSQSVGNNRVKRWWSRWSLFNFMKLITPVAKIFVPGFDAVRDVGIKLKTVSRDGERDYGTVKKEEKSLRGYIKGAPVKVVIHGWVNEGDYLFEDTVTAELVKSNIPLNILIVDWKRGSHTSLYLLAKQRIEEVGILVAGYMDYFISNEYSKPNDFTIIGFSLGAHIAGIAARRTKKGPLFKVIGLDPAGVDFEKNDYNCLHQDDAVFTEGWHTNRNGLGFPSALTKTTFFFNSESQPGCPVSVFSASCSHSRAFQYYSEFLRRGENLVGRKITSKFESNIGNPFGIFDQDGEAITHKEEGEFKIRTNDKPNFLNLKEISCKNNRPKRTPNFDGIELSANHKHKFAVGVITEEPAKTKLCSGSIISKIHILTAGHCLFVGMGQVEYTIIFDNFVEPDHPENVCKRMQTPHGIRHESYRQHTYDNGDIETENDIGLVVLLREMGENLYHPISLPSATRKHIDFYDTNFVATLGFGQHKSFENSKLNMKRYRMVPTPSYYHTYLFDETVYGEGYDDPDAISVDGDSGGPLVAKIDVINVDADYADESFYVQFGVVSGVCLDDNDNLVSQFTYVPHYIEWIRSKMHRNYNIILK